MGSQRVRRTLANAQEQQIFLSESFFVYLATLGLSCSIQDSPVSCGILVTVVVHGLWSAGSVMRCSLSCSVVCGILVPWPGFEPMSLALEGDFLTTGPAGKDLWKLIPPEQSWGSLQLRCMTWRGNKFFMCFIFLNNISKEKEDSNPKTQG